MNKMRDDQDFNINFVQIIQKEPSLYDKSLAEYRNKDEHERIWQKVAKEVNEKVPHCKERWRNLRACLTRHLKNKQQHEADSSVYHKPYYLAEYMQFLLPFTKSRSHRDTKTFSLESNDFVNFKEEREEHISAHQSDSNNEMISNSPVIVSATSIQSLGQETNVESHQQQKQQETTNKRDLNAMDDTTNTNYSEYEIKRAKIMEISSIDSKEIDDADLNFFKSLLPDIRQMSSSQKRKFKMGIFQLISNILENSE